MSHQLGKWDIEANWSRRRHFTLLDADFGEGLRFLEHWHAWRNDLNRPERLHVVGLAGRLPERAALQQCLFARVPAVLHELARKLLEAWPLNLPGLHRIDFEQGSVTLTLGVGLPGVVISRLSARIDLFYLDKALWSSESVNRNEPGQAIARLSARDALVVFPTSDFALCRALSEQGLLTALQVSPGPESEGKASEGGFCTARVRNIGAGGTTLWEQQSVEPAARHVVVIGAGFAGLGVAQSFALRGWRVTVVEAKPSDVHAQHASAALTPMVSRDDNIRARLSRAGSLRALVRWAHLPETTVTRCGALQLQREQGRIVNLSAVMDALAFPPQWARYVDASQASELAGLRLSRGGIYFSTAARIQPQGLIHALSVTPGVKVIPGSVHQLVKKGAQWQVCAHDGKVLTEAPYVVVASAQGSQAILNQSGLLSADSRLQDMHALAGEITLVPQQALSGGPRCIVSGDGYVLPAQEGFCVAGSSYAHGAHCASTSPAGVEGNLKRAAGLLSQPALTTGFSGLSLPGWAGWRAVLPGRLPAIGPVPGASGVWVACGFASRGLTYASLAGDLIASTLNAEPHPLENDIMEAISVI